jgi:hypothetical protein
MRRRQLDACTEGGKENADCEERIAELGRKCFIP